MFRVDHYTSGEVFYCEKKPYEKKGFTTMESPILLRRLGGINRSERQNCKLSLKTRDVYVCPLNSKPLLAYVSDELNEAVKEIIPNKKTHRSVFRKIFSLLF